MREADELERDGQKHKFTELTKEVQEFTVEDELLDVAAPSRKMSPRKSGGGWAFAANCRNTVRGTVYLQLSPGVGAITGRQARVCRLVGTPASHRAPWRPDYSSSSETCGVRQDSHFPLLMISSKDSSVLTGFFTISRLTKSYVASFLQTAQTQCSCS